MIAHYITGALVVNFIALNGSVIAAEYLSVQNLIVTSGSDNYLMFWEPFKGYELINKIPTREIQLPLRWYRPQKYLATGGLDLVINIYKNF